MDEPAPNRDPFYAPPAAVPPAAPPPPAPPPYGPPGFGPPGFGPGGYGARAPYGPPPRAGRPASFYVACLFAVLFIAACGFSLLMMLIAAGSGGGAGGMGASSRLREEVVESKGADKIAWIQVKGPIGDFSTFFGSVEMVEETVLQLRHAAADTSVKAVLLEVDSPGGGVTASDVIYNEVKKLNAVKPVVVHMGDLCASGGVYISAPATKLVASPTTLTGSIGVILMHVDTSRLYEEKLGIKSQPFKSGKHKDILSSDRPMTDEERKIIQDMVDQMYERFLGVVTTGRAGKGPVPKDPDAAKAYLRKLADGRIYTGEQAVQNGLVDALGYRDDALADCRKLGGAPEASLVRYRSQPTLGEVLFGSWAKHPGAGAKLPAALPVLESARFQYRLDLGRAIE